MNGAINTPGLFGLQNSNRDFTQRESWGKNNFNSSFPAALSSYLEFRGLDNIYITLNANLQIAHTLLSTQNLYGLSYNAPNLYFAFETSFSPFQQFVIGTLPRVDLVTMNQATGVSLSGIEIKLTALPDNTTCDLNENQYGTEVVVRPDTIVYLACSIANCFRNSRPDLIQLIGNSFDSINDWTDPAEMILRVGEVLNAIDRISTTILDQQEPVVMQPVWKTPGKEPRLANQCLDVFIWSNLAFIKLFGDVARREMAKRNPRISRQVRTAIWLLKMLYDFAHNGRFNHSAIIDGLSFNTKNDKAFAVSGLVTHPYMNSETLTNPRIAKPDIKDIILGGGQNLLSPERRFDAIIFNSPDLFD